MLIRQEEKILKNAIEEYPESAALIEDFLKDAFPQENLLWTLDQSYYSIFLILKSLSIILKRYRKKNNNLIYEKVSTNRTCPFQPNLIPFCQQLRSHKLQ